MLICSVFLSAGAHEGVVFPQENLRHISIGMKKSFLMSHCKLIYKVEYLTSFPASSALVCFGMSTQDIKEGLQKSHTNNISINALIKFPGLCLLCNASLLWVSKQVLGSRKAPEVTISSSARPLSPPDPSEPSSPQRLCCPGPLGGEDS